MIMNVKQDPDEITEFCRSVRRQSTVVTSSHGCVEDALPRSRRFLGDEFRLKRDWLIANGYRDNASGIYMEPEVAEKDKYFPKRRLPAVEELIQNDVIGIRGGADVNSQQRFIADDPVDLSLIEQVNAKRLPPWNARPAVQYADQDPYRLLSCYSLEEQRDVLRRGQIEAVMREQRPQRLPVPSSSPAVGVVRVPKYDVPDDDETHEHDYQPRRLMFAEQAIHSREGTLGTVQGPFCTDHDDKRTHSSLVKQKFDVERRQSPSELRRSDGSADVTSRSAVIYHERRQTWPLDAPAQPAPWFRRHHQLEAVDGSRSPASDKTAARRDVTGSGDSPLSLTDRFQTNGDERSAMSELIQLYDATMASRARNQQTGSEARAATKSIAADDEDDEMMSTGQPGAADQVDDDSMNSVGKKYVCHICPFVG